MSPDLLADVEDASLNASAPMQQRWVDGWWVRYCPGKAKRARSVNAVAPGRLPLPEKLARAQSIYREAGLPMVVRITPYSQPPELDDTLERQGWTRFDETCVMVLPRIDTASAVASGPDGHAVELPETAFAELIGTWRGSPAHHRAAHVERLRCSPVRYHGYALEVDGVPVACGQYAREGVLVGLYDIHTAPEARGRGHATTLCSSLLQHAAADGARIGYLQVDAHNAPALAVYRKLGFAEGYRYHYRAEDAAAASA